MAQEAGVAVSIVPQPLAWRAAEQIAGFGLGRQRDDVPVLAATLHFRDDAAGKVVLVPAGLDQPRDPSLPRRAVVKAGLRHVPLAAPW